ncbi:hypothetical protein TNCT_699671 [Trichonephila clavata]|uniref:Uncharacterized protein n=1 Tax=Trichonephila clavata TaxID=2740835 RepID=A0A8X6HG65_TRICU|nr:hypothetical protein TNCT_699671 [Trichonephila clavata]
MSKNVTYQRFERRVVVPLPSRVKDEMKSNEILVSRCLEHNGNLVSLYSTAVKRTKDFKIGWESLEDEPCSGLSKNCFPKDIFSKVHQESILKNKKWFD